MRQDLQASDAAQAAMLGSGVQNNYFGARLPAGVLLKTAARDPRSVFAAIGLGNFTGRDWLVAEVDEFMVSAPCGYVFIEAGAGLGKTAFAAFLVKTRGYLSHFARYAEGGSVPVALGNLAAQLIAQFGLDDQAPGGMLPVWAQTPGGFESLLAAAAEAAGHRSPVVLVADGLDEAEAPDGALPFGLPLMLPEGVFVIGTYRTGHAPRRPDAPSRVVPIGRDDPRNRRDIGEFLAAAAEEAVLAARLAEAGADGGAFAAVLAERCGGVWVYLRYVLDELRIGLRRPDEVSTLPAGLRNYYADQVRRWQQDPDWRIVTLPLLATLGAAGEALPAASLARLAGGLDLAAVQRRCNLQLRPMLAVTRQATPGAVLQYEIYHSSFRELLSGFPGDQPSPPDDLQPFELLAVADELGQATIAAHSRICDAYLRYFGGLDAGLSLLVSDPDATSVDGSYPLRHLARHLSNAGRVGDLHLLLAAEHRAHRDHLANTWFAAHDRADSIVSYLADLSFAWTQTATATDDDLHRGRTAPALGTEMRYALMAASVASTAGKIPASLLEQLVSSGVWSFRRGLDHARGLVDPSSRLEALLAVYRYLNAEDQPAVLAQALDTATVITDGKSRAGALARLAPHLPPDLLAQALTTATTITNDQYRAAALTGLAPHLPPDLLAQALTTATTITNDQYRALALTRLAPHLPPDLLAQALAGATAVSKPYYRGQALNRLAAHLPPADRPALLNQALAAAFATTDTLDKARALIELVPHFLAIGQSAVLDRMLALATAIPDDIYRAEALAVLAPHLPPDLLAQALTEATTMSNPYYRAEALAGLAPYLPPDLLTQALTAVTAITIDHYGIRTLAGLAPHLPSDLLTQALTTAIAIPSSYDRAEALAGLAPHLTPDLLAQALAAAIADIQDSGSRALTGLAPYLPPDLLAQALTAAATITNPHFRTRALTELAPHLPRADQPATLAQALAAANVIGSHQDRIKALTRLAPHLPAADRPAVVADLLDAATAPADGFACVLALTALARHLPPGDQPAVLAQALDAANRITSAEYRTRALTRLVPHLPPDDRPAVLAQVLDAANRITDSQFGSVLAEVAQYLPADLLTRALAAVTANQTSFHSLGQLAPYLPAELLARALTAAIAYNHPYTLAEALTGLAPYLPADLLAQGLTEARAITYSLYRVRALAGLAPHLPPDDQPAVLSQALDAAAMVTDEFFRVEALTGLAPQLPADLLAQALMEATAITDSLQRARALAGLAPHLPADLLAQALATALTFTNDNYLAWALTGLSPHLPPDDRPAVLARALAAATSIDGQDRARPLTGLAPHLPEDLLAQALTAAITITTDQYRAAALAGLAPHLPEDLLAQALTAATIIATDEYRAAALAGLAPHLPENLLAAAANSAPRTFPHPLVTLLERQHAFHVHDPHLPYVRLLRDCINGTDRKGCLEIVASAAQAIAEIGGVAAIRQCADAVADAYRWWP
jgi:hypothetical protein